MDTLLYMVIRAAISAVQAMPLLWVARLGRFGGAVAYALDARHRRMAVANLTLCFGGKKPPTEIRRLARENFRRIGENFACAAKTAGMSADELKSCVVFCDAKRFTAIKAGAQLRGRVFAIGHFGNFELYARFGQFVPDARCATTYRGLQQPALERLLKSLRETSGCRFFERRTESDALKAAMTEPGMLLGLLADQHAGRSGVRLPFLGHDCSTSTAPALFALRYDCPLHTAICYRVGLGRWEIEAGDEIPTRDPEGNRRPISEIMLDVNRTFEEAVLRDPANWFWVHNRWKPVKPPKVRSRMKGAKSGAAKQATREADFESEETN